MQLYAFLESLHCYCSGFDQISILYRCSSPDYEQGYEKVAHAFPNITLIKQTNPPYDFKPLLIQQISNSESKYLTFAVDDIIVTGNIDFNECVSALDTTQAYGFFLRLGQNIDDCLSSNEFGGIPPLRQVTDQIYSWQFKTGMGNWAYPNTLDMTIYRKKGIKEHLNAAPFSNPNTLEDHFGVVNLEQMGLCYETSKIVNIPLNIVSQTSATAHLNISAKELLGWFNAGFKIDIAPFFQCHNRSAHLFNTYPSFILQGSP